STQESERWRREIERMSNLLEGTLQEEFEELRRQAVQAREEGEARGRAEGRVEGQIEGRVEGQIEGRVEGELRTAREILLSLLEERFGSVPDDWARRIESCEDVDQLKAWTRRLVKASSLEEL